MEPLEIGFLALLSLVFIITLVVSWLLFKSFPPETISILNEILVLAHQLADKTPTTIDDKLVDAADKIKDVIAGGDETDPK